MKELAAGKKFKTLSPKTLEAFVDKHRKEVEASFSATYVPTPIAPVVATYNEKTKQWVAAEHPVLSKKMKASSLVKGRRYLGGRLIGSVPRPGHFLEGDQYLFFNPRRHFKGKVEKFAYTEKKLARQVYGPAQRAMYFSSMLERSRKNLPPTQLLLSDWVAKQEGPPIPIGYKRVHGVDIRDPDYKGSVFDIGRTPRKEPWLREPVAVAPRPSYLKMGWPRIPLEYRWVWRMGPEDWELKKEVYIPHTHGARKVAVGWQDWKKADPQLYPPHLTADDLVTPGEEKAYAKWKTKIRPSVVRSFRQQFYGLPKNVRWAIASRLRLEELKRGDPRFLEGLLSERHVKAFSQYLAKEKALTSVDVIAFPKIETPVSKLLTAEGSKFVAEYNLGDLEVARAAKLANKWGAKLKHGSLLYELQGVAEVATTEQVAAKSKKLLDLQWQKAIRAAKSTLTPQEFQRFELAAKDAVTHLGMEIEAKDSKFISRLMKKARVGDYSQEQVRFAILRHSQRKHLKRVLKGRELAFIDDVMAGGGISPYKIAKIMGVTPQMASPEFLAEGAAGYALEGRKVFGWVGIKKFLGAHPGTLGYTRKQPWAIIPGVSQKMARFLLGEEAAGRVHSIYHFTRDLPRKKIHTKEYELLRLARERLIYLQTRITEDVFLTPGLAAQKGALRGLADDVGESLTAINERVRLSALQPAARREMGYQLVTPLKKGTRLVLHRIPYKGLGTWDPLTVAVMAPTGETVGYLPGEIAKQISPKMRRGFIGTATFEGVTDAAARVKMKQPYAPAHAPDFLKTTDVVLSGRMVKFGEGHIPGTIPTERAMTRIQLEKTIRQQFPEKFPTKPPISQVVKAKAAGTTKRVSEAVTRAGIKGPKAPLIAGLAAGAFLLGRMGRDPQILEPDTPRPVEGYFRSPQAPAPGMREHAGRGRVDGMAFNQPTARITDPNAIDYGRFTGNQLDIDIDGRDGRGLDYQQVGQFMAAMAREATGFETASVNINVRDDSTTIDDEWMRRRVHDILLS